MILRCRHSLSDDFTFAQGIDLRIEADRIVERGPRLAPRDGERIVDVPDGIALPGWINPHAHLELSGMRGALPREVGFVPWVRELVALRRGKDEAWFDAGIDAGLAESLDAGTTAIGEVTTSGRTGARVPATGAAVYLFEEAIAFDPARADAMAAAMASRVEGTPEGHATRRRAIAPHAPYTVSESLFGKLGDYATRRRIPISVHVNETPDELRMFASGDGALFEFLEGLGEIPRDWSPPGMSPIAWLDAIGFLACRPVLVHANYLTDDDIARVRRAGSVVVFCPRSHRFFGHRDHPFARLRAAGVPVALGTDSLASNDSLCMLEEVRELRRQFPDTSPEALFDCAFGAGARALEGAAASGSSEERGRLRVGSRADVVVYVADRPVDDPHAAAAYVLEEADRPHLVVAGGVVVRAREPWLRDLVESPEE